jgi:hypothetical protein
LVKILAALIGLAAAVVEVLVAELLVQVEMAVAATAVKLLQVQQAFQELDLLAVAAVADMAAQQVQAVLVWLLFDMRPN